MSGKKPTPAEIVAALEATGCRRAPAAELLGVWTFTLRKYIAAYEALGFVFPDTPAQPVNYEPTRKEIRAACKAIQASWSPAEKHRRAVQRVEAVEIREVEAELERDAEW